MDTSIFIYFMERHPRYAPPLRSLFAEADAGQRRLVTSAITLLEVLVAPIKRHDPELIYRYLRILRTNRSLQVVPLNRRLLVSAAILRAQTSARTPDALQLAAAISTRCATFLTNDRRMPHTSGLKIVQLDDFC